MPFLTMVCPWTKHLGIGDWVLGFGGGVGNPSAFLSVPFHFPECRL